ncbi:AAA family ATPase [Micromonospora sp. NPDC047707]|uniref:helix-turn-helix transcriptional regulator n=1 Tax=Micromonospora sp. NPDC047707 TaxID=3154498 RepID=UPI00345610B0
MIGGGVEPGRFVGRSDAMAKLQKAYEHVDDAEQATTVLVSGEAGIGKSRLLREFCDQYAGDAMILIGHCIELGEDASPYAPFVAALRQAVRQVGLKHLIDQLPAGAAEDLALLLPEFGAPPSTAAVARGRLFETVLLCFERLAAERRIVLGIEDVHWGDRSTWDLLRFLVACLDDARILIVATHRDLPYGVPMRPMLLDLRRSGKVRTIELPALSAEEVTEQATDILGHRPSRSTLDDLIARSGGNPFYVEALLASEPGDNSAFRHLLLLAVERLPEHTQRMLNILAVAGTAVAPADLMKVSRMDAGAVDEALYPAVNASVVTATDDGYAFRHELIREAVYDALLPGGRLDIHRRYAEAFETVADDLSRAADIARHWHAAGDVPFAFTAAWRAGEAARAALAHAERFSMLNRVLRLWPLVPDAQERIGMSRAEVLRAAVEAADESGEPERGLTLAADAIAAAESAGLPLVAAQVLERRARIRRRLGRRGAREDLLSAIALVPSDPPTAIRARLLGFLAQRYWVEGRNEQARAAANEALALADQVGDEYAQIHARISLVGLDVEAGRLERAKEYEPIRAAARRIAVPMLEVRSYIEQSFVLTERGAYHQAVKIAREGLQLAGQAGLSRTLGARVATYLAEALMIVGQWDEALEVIAHVEELEPPAGYLAALLALRGRIEIARGDTGRAADTTTRIKELVGDEADTPWELYLRTWLEAEIHLARHAPTETVRTVLRALDTHPAPLEPMLAWPVLVLAARAAHRAAVWRNGGEPVPERLAFVANQLPARTPWEDAHRASFAAEMAQPAVRGAAAAAALAAWDKTGLPHPTAAALLDAAESAANDGDRGLAAKHLARAAALAAELGAHPLLDEAAGLARRARVSMEKPAGGESAGAPAHAPASPYGLTGRELEVLELLAEGSTNRQIAQQLFMSAKTASVHVSRILAKLGVTNRGQAAALVHRIRLFDQPGT